MFFRNLSGKIDAPTQFRHLHHAAEFLCVLTAGARQNQVCIDLSRCDKPAIAVNQCADVFSRLDGSQIENVRVRYAEAGNVASGFVAGSRAETRINAPRSHPHGGGPHFGHKPQQIATRRLRRNVDQVGPADASANRGTESCSAMKAAMDLRHREERHVVNREQMPRSPAPHGHKKRGRVNNVVGGQD